MVTTKTDDCFRDAVYVEPRKRSTPDSVKDDPVYS
jgi:hypothetical protein